MRSRSCTCRMPSGLPAVSTTDSDVTGRSCAFIVSSAATASASGPMVRRDGFRGNPPNPSRLLSMGCASTGPGAQVNCKRLETGLARKPAVAGHKQDRCLVNGRSAIRFADEIGDAFRTHLCRVLTPCRYFTVIAGLECLRLVVAGYCGFAAQHHDPHVKVVRV